MLLLPAHAGRVDELPAGQAISWPPDTLISIPTACCARSEARKTTQLATSSGWPMRPMRVFERRRSRAPGEDIQPCVIGVSTLPGETQLTLMLYGATYRAR